MKRKNILQGIMVVMLSIIMVVYLCGSLRAEQIQKQSVKTYQEVDVSDSFILKQIEKKYYSKEEITKQDINVVVKIVAKRHGIKEELIKAMVKIESSYKIHAESHCGARGLMQLMPVTAREVGVRDRFNPVQNVRGGVIYLKKLLNEFDGDLTLALASYNAGIGTVKRLGRVPQYEETINYIEKVNKFMV